MLTGEMIQTVRDQGAELGRTAAAALLERPSVAGEVARVWTGIVAEFSAMLKRAPGFTDEDVVVLCQELREAYQAELPPGGNVTKH